MKSGVFTYRYRFLQTIYISLYIPIHLPILFRMSPDDERRFLRRRNPINEFDSGKCYFFKTGNGITSPLGGSIEGSRNMSPAAPHANRLTHSHSDSEDLSTLTIGAASSNSNSFSHSVGNLSMFRSSPTNSSNYNRSNNASTPRMSLGEIIFGSTSSSSQTINSTTLY